STKSGHCLTGVIRRKPAKRSWEPKSEDAPPARPVRLGGLCLFWQTPLLAGYGPSHDSLLAKPPQRRSPSPKPVSQPISPPRLSDQMRRTIALLRAVAATSDRSTEGLRDPD